MLKGHFLSAASFLVFLLVPCTGYAFDDGEFQYWSSESISWKIDGDWQLNLSEELRFGDDAGDLYYQHTDLGLVYSGFAGWLDIGANYRQIFEEKKSEWKYENRPHFNATVKFNLADWALSNRGMFEYRHREDSDNFWRYRNKFTIKTPFKLTPLAIQPYVADEIFADFDKEELNVNRFYAGFALKLFAHLKGEIYYLWQSSKKEDKWTDYNVLGTKLKLSF